jgi:hypothetical protein
MRRTLSGTIILAAIAAAAMTVTPAHADPYKWCAVYGGRDGNGGKNCGFVTLEQCRATISGAGGTCEPNPFYTGGNSQQNKRKTR